MLFQEDGLSVVVYRQKFSNIQESVDIIIEWDVLVSGIS